jgi:2-polyprenyl-3-methyl-5-hydroxy-6-metoxy-1,4-benzoquinol methylase
METSHYLMEHDKEAVRLDLKTREDVVETQAEWAGLKPGMRVADIGCGSGKTTSILHRLVQPSGEVVGIDGSEIRLEYARTHHAQPGIRYIRRRLPNSLQDLGPFDFIWSRFFLEYHRSRSRDIIDCMVKALRPGGILCLIDLDNNCLSHYGQSDNLGKTLHDIMRYLEQHHDFDPFIGRKLYSFLFDRGFEEIRVRMEAHHLIYGNHSDIDVFNWDSKVQVAAKNSGYDFTTHYSGGFPEFYADFESFFRNPRRFTYTPVFICRGTKPNE